MFKFIGRLFYTAIILWLCGLLWFVSAIPHSPSSDDTITDAIVVLTGGSLRIEQGLSQLVAQKARRLFISGVEENVSLNALLKTKEYKEFAHAVSSKDITLGYTARDTVGNAKEVAQWVAKEHITSIRLVTGNYHMPRSILEIKEAAPTLTIIPVPVFPKNFENNEWWKFNNSAVLVLSEYHKYIYSWVKYL